MSKNRALYLKSRNIISEQSNIKYDGYRIVQHIVKNSQYGQLIVAILTKYCNNVVQYIVNFYKTVIIYVNRLWSQFGENLNINSPHAINVHDDGIVKRTV